MSFNERWPWSRMLKWFAVLAVVQICFYSLAYLRDPTPFHMAARNIERLWHWGEEPAQVVVKPIEGSQDTGVEIAVEPAVASKPSGKRGLPQTLKVDPAPKAASVSVPKQVVVPSTKKIVETQKPAQKSEAERLWQAGANPAPFDQLPSPIPFKEPPPVPTQRQPTDYEITHNITPQPTGPTIISNGSTVTMKALKAGLVPVEDQISLCNWDDIRRSKADDEPLISGIIELEYVVGLDGGATVTRVRRDTMKHPELTECVITAIGLMRIDSGEAPTAPTNVRHPFEFNQY